MKRMLTTCVALGSLAAAAITVQNAPNTTVVRGDSGTVVVNTAAPKYSLSEAITQCINELSLRGEEVTVGSVKNRLQRMSASDVDLNVSGLSRTIREAIEAHEAVQAKAVPAPDPAKYDKREKFVADYVAWKTKGLTAAEKKDMRGRMGAEAKFRRATKDEANAIWQKQENEKKGE